LSGNSHGFQPPDAENRMSGGVGGVTGAIPLSPPDLGCVGGNNHLAVVAALNHVLRLSGNHATGKAGHVA